MALFVLSSLQADGLPDVGRAAPRFSVPTHEGTPFDLADRRGKGWTVLYFYPKAGTPGCTKQACAFRDAHKVIEALGAKVYGLSADSVEDLARFHRSHRLSFPLLSDEDAKVMEAYGAKYPLLRVAKRWTFLIDPLLRVRWVDRDVDPMLDAKQVAEKLEELQAQDARRRSSLPL